MLVFCGALWLITGLQIGLSREGKTLKDWSWRAPLRGHMHADAIAQGQSLVRCGCWWWYWCCWRCWLCCCWRCC